MNIVFNICLFRQGLACSMFKGEIWTAGGWNGRNLALVETYSIDEGFIAELPSMPTAR